jgi:branched-chain amino acid transport system permease protein
MSRRDQLVVLIVIVALLACAPWLGPLIHLDISIVAAALIYAIAAMSVNLLLGLTGLPAFGNAAYFGLGAYGVALSIKYWHVHFLEAIVIGTAAAFLGALVLAPFLLRRRGIYFGLLSIAFGEIFYFIAYRFTDVTGGEDGMNVARPPLVVPGARIILDELHFYYIALAVFVAAILAFGVIANSPFGRTLVAIRQNEARVRYLGLDSDRFIFVALLISATLAGLSGALYALSINFAYPLMLDWHQSGYFVIMMILGGAGTVWGPLVGSTIYVIGQDIISTITPRWQIILGALFVACVLGFPRGILGSIGAFMKRRAAVTGDDELEHPLDAAPVAEGRRSG